MSIRRGVTPERDLEQHFRKAVKKAGGKAIKLAPIEAGTPDRLVLFPGPIAYFVELKTKTGVVSEVQKLWHERAARLGWHVHVLYGREGIDAWIRAVLDSLPPHSRAAAAANRT